MPNTTDLHAALRHRFDPQAFALMFEVADATGARHSRWADAVAVGLWPSRGLTIEGFELKASRTDWLKELKQPAKAEAICRYCHHWWLVISDAKFVYPGELPETWGLLIPSGKGGLKIAKPAPRLTPQPVSAEFLAALLRAAAKPDVTERQKAIQQAEWKGRRDAQAQCQREVDQANKSRDELFQRVAAFEAASGVTIQNRWDSRDPRRTGEVVRQVLNGDHDKDLSEIKRIRDVAARLISTIDDSGVLQEAG